MKLSLTLHVCALYHQLTSVRGKKEGFNILLIIFSCSVAPHRPVSDVPRCADPPTAQPPPTDPECTRGTYFPATCIT